MESDQRFPNQFEGKSGRGLEVGPGVTKGGARDGAEMGAGRQLEREIRRMDSAYWCGELPRSVLAPLAGFQLPLPQNIS